MFQTEHLQEKWQPVLEHPDLPKIEDAYKRAVTTVILENQEKALKEDKAEIEVDKVAAIEESNTAYDIAVEEAEKTFIAEEKAS
jgi:hypothetical protein